MHSKEEIVKRFSESKERPCEVIKEIISSSMDTLRTLHDSTLSGKKVVNEYTTLIDNIIHGLFTHFAKDSKQVISETALVAVGGYGRAELNIRSDIDLMLVCKDELKESAEKITEKILYELWDSSLDIAFSLRTIQESVELGRTDLSTATSFLDLRHLYGSKKLFNEFVKTIDRKLFTKRALKKFVKDKNAESYNRLKKYGSSVYILEPNIKEGAGGLRDIHTARWLVNSKLVSDTTHDIVKLKLLSEEDNARLQQAFDFLLWVRNEVHFDSTRKTDQLTFDNQKRISEKLGYKDTEHSLGVEQFIQSYYIEADIIANYSGYIISRLLKKKKKLAFLYSAAKFNIDEDFHIFDEEIYISKSLDFEKKPEALMSAFLHFQNHKAAFHQTAVDKILKYTYIIDDEFRNNKDIGKIFIKILNGKRIFQTFSIMHKLRVLDNYIPEFAAIKCKSQFDRYHVYTVDIHTLFALREYDRLRKEKYVDDYDVLSNITEFISNKPALVLGIMFHDIGKALGKGHAMKGANLVPQIGKRIGLDEDTIDLIKYLVLNHLILPDTAQYRDIYDEKLIVEIAKKSGSMLRWDYLYVLTFCDVRAVGPDVWTKWKSALFQELFLRVRGVLERGNFEVEGFWGKIDAKEATVKELLKDNDELLSKVSKHFAMLQKRYFLSNTPQSIAKHIELIDSLTIDEPIVFHVEQDSKTGYTKFIITTHDVSGLFAMISGVMAAEGISILNAEINTLKNGIALDILHVKTTYNEAVTDSSKIEKIRNTLNDVITSKKWIKDFALQKFSHTSLLDESYAKPHVPTHITVDNSVSELFTIIDVKAQSRPALLYEITSTLAELGLFIYVAKISTKGDTVSDIFYVKDIFGHKITDEQKIHNIVDLLRSNIDHLGKKSSPAA